MKESNSVMKLLKPVHPAEPPQDMRPAMSISSITSAQLLTISPCEQPAQNGVGFARMDFVLPYICSIFQRPSPSVIIFLMVPATSPASTRFPPQRE